MADLQTDMASDYKQASCAMELFSAALLDFHAACLRLDWKACEKSRGDAQAALDGYLDNLAAAYKRMESGP